MILQKSVDERKYLCSCFLREAFKIEDRSKII